MSVFSKLNQIKDLKQQAKQMQSSLSQELVEVSRSGVVLKMDGNQKVQSLSIPDGTSNKELENIIPNLFNDAILKIQKIMSDKFKSGEIKMPDLNF